MQICAIGLCIFLVTAVFSTEANGFNQPPVAIDDNYFMDINEISKELPILDNDYDPDDFEVELDPYEPGENDPGSVTIVQKPTQGTVVVNDTTGVVTYTLNNEISSKMDNFTYYVCDIFGLKSNIATASITFLPGEENTPPVANNDTASIECNANYIQIEVLTNDIDNEDGTPNLDNITKPPEHGDALINGDKIRYTSEGNFSGIDSFIYQVIDSGGLTDTAIVNVTVFPCQENKKPIAVNDSATTDEDTSITINILANDSDPDLDPVRFVGITQQPAHGVAEIVNETYNISKVRYTPDRDFNGIDVFYYQITDGSLTDIGQVTIIINPINDAPVSVNDSDTTDRNNAITVDVLSNDYDPDGDDLSLVNVTQAPQYGSAEIIDDLTCKYTPFADFTGIDTFQYQISDPDDLTDTAMVTITVNQIEEPPTSTGGGRAGTSSSPSTNHPPIADASAGEPYHEFIDEEITFDGSLSHDPDGTIISYHWNFDDGTFGNGEIVNNTYSSPKAHLVTLTVIDNKGATDTCITTVAISQPNRPPSGPDIYGPEICIMGTKYSYAALSRDSDGDNIKYVFDWDDNNTDESEFLSLQRSYAVSFIHSWSSAGNYTIIVTVSDNQTVSSSEISVVVIEPPYDYTAVIILGSIMAFFVILSLILVKTGAISKFGKK